MFALAGATDAARLALKQLELPDLLDTLDAKTHAAVPDALLMELEDVQKIGGVTHLKEVCARVEIPFLLLLHAASVAHVAVELLSRPFCTSSCFDVHWSDHQAVIEVLPAMGAVNGRRAMSAMCIAVRHQSDQVCYSLPHGKLSTNCGL